MAIELSDKDLLLRLTNYEDHFVERKTGGDSKDWLKTVVGFANSVPIGYPAVLYIGVRDNGDIEDGLNLDTLQKTFGKKLEDAYPPIYYLPKVLAKGGKQFLAVIIPGSESRPHFAGPSYVRAGSETKIASEAEFQTLIAQRQSKAYEILKWKGSEIAIEHHMGPSRTLSGTGYVKLLDCNQFYLTYLDNDRRSLPLSCLDICHDNARNCLKIEVRLY